MHLHPPEDRQTPADLPGSASRPARASVRARLAWAGGIGLLLLLLVVTPPLVNANRYRGKIAESMSKSLGRPVHLDAVSLHLLPTPGFTLQNLVVSEDPAFGAEPTIRANTVEASLRIASLWHRPVEFSTVRFVEPSVNLVRSPEGRWNLSDVLLHAARVQSAPTVQRRAGPTPRFPYIEATGGRVNVKLGAEKLPFSLTEADFALWLPSPQQWRVRLVGHPARTDTNITDPGRLRLEGELRRAETVVAVPAHFDLSWHDAPLGEATRIVTGDDWGWRGTVNMDASFAGTLGDGRLSSKITLGGLRRAEFFPAQPLALQITCGSQVAFVAATLTSLRCTLPDDAPQPLTLASATLHLQQPAATDATLQGSAIPVRWMLLWAALFSPRVPTDLQPGGTLDVDIAHAASPTAAPPVAIPTVAIPRSLRARASPGGTRNSPPPSVALAWTGTVHMLLPAAGNSAGTADAAVNSLVWELAAPAAGTRWPTLRLPVTTIVPGRGSSLALSGAVGQAGYTLNASGSAAPAALLTPARYLPELGDGLEAVLPFPPTGITPTRVQISCSRPWNTAQQCTGPEPADGNTATAVAGSTSATSTSPTAPSLLTPRNLSPLERAPFSSPPQPAPLGPHTLP